MHSLDIDRASSLCLSPPPGKMAGIFGDGATRLVLGTLARPLLHGETIAAVDGGNRFDPYEIGKAAKALGGDGKEALSRIRVSRAFTCYQMEALLSRRLPEALSRFDARLALIIGLPETFSDADVPYAEACRVFRNCLSALRRITHSGTRVVLVGQGKPPTKNYHSVGPAPGNRSGFFQYLVRTAEPLLLLRRREEGWAWEFRPAETRLARGGS